MNEMTNSNGTVETTNEKTSARPNFYYVSLGVVQWVNEHANKTLSFFEERGEAYDKELSQKFEDTKSDFSEWKGKVTDEVKELTTIDGLKKRADQFGTDIKDVSAKFGLFKKEEKAETADEAAENAVSEETTEEHQPA